MKWIDITRLLASGNVLKCKRSLFAFLSEGSLYMEHVFDLTDLLLRDAKAPFP